MCHVKNVGSGTHIFLLFIDVPDLEPDIYVGKGIRWVSEDTIEALEYWNKENIKKKRRDLSIPRDFLGISAVVCI